MADRFLAGYLTSIKLWVGDARLGQRQEKPRRQSRFGVRPVRAFRLRNRRSTSSPTYMRLSAISRFTPLASHDSDHIPWFKQQQIGVVVGP